MQWRRNRIFLHFCGTVLQIFYGYFSLNVLVTFDYLMRFSSSLSLEIFFLKRDVTLHVNFFPRDGVAGMRNPQIYP